MRFLHTLDRSVPVEERIVAVALLTRQELDVLGPSFDRAWPVEEAPFFGELLKAIDEADHKLARESEPHRPAA